MCEFQSADSVPFISVVEQIQQQALHQGTVNAIICNGKQLSYTELDDLSNRLARTLRRRAFAPETIIGFFVERSPLVYVIELGIMKAGLAFMPFTQDYPEERIRFCMENAQSPLLITSEKQGFCHLASQSFTLTRIEDLLQEEDSACALPSLNANSLAFCLYTSGSTGSPKAVVVEHASLAENVRIAPENLYSLAYTQSGQYVMAVTSLAFIASPVFDFVALCQGRTIILATEQDLHSLSAIIGLLTGYTVAAAFFTPSFVASLIQVAGGAESLQGLRAIAFAGERIDESLTARLWKISPSLRLFNAYGCTELGGCTASELLPTKKITIGHPLSGVQCLVLDENGQPAKEGELVVLGKRLARGYLKLSSTAFREYKGQRAFWTGDRVAWTEEGELELFGRNDDMVKFHGQRVELKEIEAVALRTSGIERCVCLVRKRGNDETLTCFFVAEAGFEKQTLADVLRANLARYMVPDVLVQLDALPLLANGKVDRMALLAMDCLPSRAYVTPETEVEKHLCEIYASVLGLERVSVEDSFFELGGSSLSAARLISLLPTELSYQDLFTAPSPHSLARCILAAKSSQGEKSAKEERRCYPVTKTQLGMYLEISLKKVSYTVHFLAKASPELSPERIIAVVKQVLVAYPSLFFIIEQNEEGIPEMCMHPELLENLSIPVIEAGDRESFMRDFARPILLDGEFLLRFAVLKTESACFLGISAQHMLLDGTSLMLFIEECNRVLEGKAPRGERYSLQEAALREASLSQEKSKAYYEELLGKLEEFSSLSGDRNEASDEVKAFRGRGLQRIKVTALCTRLRMTENAFFQTVLALVLSKYLHSESPVFTAVYNGRTTEAMQHTIGTLIKNIPVAVKLSGEMELAQLLKSVNQQLLASMSQEGYSFDDILRDYGLSHEVEFIYQGDLFAETGQRKKLGPDPWLREHPSTELPTALLSIQLFAEQSDYELSLSYKSGRFSEIWIRHFVANFFALAESMLTARLVRQVQMMPLESQAKIAGFNDTQVDFPFVPVAEQIHRQAQRAPLRPAIISSEMSLSYQELDEQSSLLAALLKSQGGVRAHSFVALILDRTPLAFVAELAILKAGASFMPLLPSYPDERIAFCLKDAGCSCIITSASVQAQHRELFSAYSLVKIDDALSAKSLALLREQQGELVGALEEVSPEDIAYCLYTSGTTGRPKGVKISQRAVANYVHVNEKSFVERAYALPERVSLAMAALSFDVSIEEVYLPLCNGNTVCVATEEEVLDSSRLASLILSNGVTALCATPSFLSTLLDLPECQTALQQIECFDVGAEAFPASLLPRLRALRPDSIIINSYGPTETTVACAGIALEPGDEVSIGRPMANVSFFVADQYGNSLPEGVQGELIICGAGVSSGYINVPEQTAKAFFVTEDGRRAYHSGDFALWTEEGYIRIVGRIDKQVKIRGFRVELEEIERLMTAYSGVSASVAIVKDQSVLAFFTGEERVETGELHRTLAAQLADYMLPAALIQLDRLPLTQHGKIDRKALAAYSITPQTEAEERVLPANELEEKLLRLVEDFLERTEIGVTEKLVALGLTSLGAMRLSSLSQKRLGLTISALDIMRLESIRAMADFLKSKSHCLLPPVSHGPKRDLYPLTESQRALYLEWEKAPQSTQYNIPRVFFLGNKKRDLLLSAVRTVVQAHPCLHIAFVRRDAEIYQAVQNGGRIEIACTSLPFVPDLAFFQPRVKPFDLFKDKLYRLELYEAEDGMYLFMDVHHMIFDGISSAIFEQELIAAYEGKSIREETVTALELAVYEQELKGTPALREAEAYFDRLAQGASIASLYESSCPEQLPIVRFEKRLDSEAITNFCTAHAVTENSYFHAAFADALYRVTREKRALYLTASGGRASSHCFENAIGMFVKTLPVVFEQKERVVDFVKAMQVQLQESYRRDFSPYTSFVERHALQGEIFFLFQGGILDIEEREPIKFLLDKAQFPLSVEVYRQRGSYIVSVEYDGYRYSQKDIEAFIDFFLSLAQDMVGAECCAEIETLSAQEKLRLNSFNETSIEIPFVPLPEQIHRRAEEHPSALAIISSESSLSYRELDSLSSQLARALVQAGLEPHDFVALLLDRSPLVYVAELAILKAGAVFVPLLPSYPDERIAFCLQDGQCWGLITTKAVPARSLEGEHSRIFFLEDFLRQTGEESTSCVQCSCIQPSDIAYCLYTSGTTGKPKAVPISHGSLVNYLDVNPKSPVETAYVAHGRISLAMAALSFDVAIEEAYLPLAHGNTVCIATEEEILSPQRLAELIRAQGVTALCATPSFLTTLLDLPECQPALQQIECFDIGAESFPPSLLPRLRALRSDSIIINSYGPTETTVACAGIALEPGDEVSIGRPMANVSFVVADPYGRSLPRGLRGELIICGAGVSRGYQNLPEKTADAFFSYGELPAFHSGDLAAWTEEGTIRIYGRIDRQVKWHGFRIELGEIEKVAMDYPSLQAAVALIVAEQDVIALFFTAEEQVDQKTLREHLQSRLASYMLPSVMMQMEQFPLTAHGKLDRKALASQRLSLETSFDAPATEREAMLFSIVAELLQTEKFGVTSRLLSLGFSSLAAMRLSSRIHTACGQVLSVSELLRLGSIRAIAAALEEAKTSLSAPVFRSDIEPYDYQKCYPLSENQRGIFFGSESTTRYNMPQVIRFIDKEPERLRRAIEKAVNNHPCLKMRLAKQDGEIVQERHDEEAVQISLEQRDSFPEDEVRALVQPFRLFSEPLYRLHLYVCPDASYLFIDSHHLVSDGLSSGILKDDIERAYRGESLLPEGLTAYDLSLYEADLLASQEACAAAEAHFDRLADGANLAFYPRSDQPDGQPVVHLERVIPGEKITTFCEEHALTIGSYFHAAFAETLQRVTREEKALFLSVSTGRTSYGEKLDRSVGMFVKTLPVVVDKTEEVLPFMQAMQEQLETSYRLDWYPYTRFVERHSLRGEILLLVQVGITEEEEIEAAERMRFVLDGVDLPLSVEVYEKDHGKSYILFMEYDGTRYARREMEVLHELFARLLLSLPDAKLRRDIELLSPRDRQLLERYNQTAVEIPFVPIPEQIRRQDPQSLAVMSSQSKLSYGELDAQSSRLASILIQQGVQKNDFVALLLPRTPFVYVAELAVLKAGAAFVPLLPSYPDERIAFCLEDAGCSCIITTEAVQKEHRGILVRSGYKLLLQEELPALDCQDRGDEESRSLAVQQSIGANDLAYCLYTSGTTGKPKGVKISHGNLVNYVHVNPSSPVETAYVAHGKVSLAIAAFSFDVAIEEAYLPLCHGNSVCLATEEEILDPKRLAELICSMGVTALCATPSFLSTLLTLPECQTALQQIECFDVGAESFPPTLLPQLRAVRSDSIIINSYGPTETTVACAGIALEPGDEVTIGRPMANVSFVVADQYGNALPLGLRGELIICGAGVGLGYQDLPEKTAESFFSYGDLPAYHSGDLAAWTEEGTIRIYGRIDRQIKWHGFRIELEEIERVLLSYTGIQTAVVLMSEEKLVGFVTAEGRVKTEELVHYLQSKLADYMVPACLVQLEQMPTTVHGKIDRKALANYRTTGDYLAPATAQERALFAIAAELLTTKDFGVTDRLLSLGMSSLMTMRFCYRVQTELGYELSVADCMRLGTIARIAAASLEGKGERRSRLKPYSKREYYPLSENQRALYLEWEMQRSSTRYNIPQLFRFTDKDPQRLQAALIAVVNNHPCLKMRLAWLDGELFQQRRDDDPVELSLTVLDYEPDAAFFQERVRAFRLFTEALYRLELYQSPTALYLFMDSYHMVFDGLSSLIFERELEQAYLGEPLVGESVSAFDFALYEKDCEEGEGYKEAEAYFDALAKNASAVGYPSSLHPDGKALASVEARFSAKGMQAFCAEQGITVGSYLHAVFGECLYRICRDEKPLYLTISHGRSAYGARLENAVGMFVKTVPVVVTGEEKVVDFVQAMHSQIQKSYSLDFYGYTRFVERHHLRGEIFFAYQGEEREQKDALLFNDAPQFPISVELNSLGDELLLSLEYDGQRYSEQEMRGLASLYRRLAKAMLTRGLRSELELLSQEEQEQLARFNDTAVAIPFVPVAEQIAAQDASTIALVSSGERSLAYGELNEYAIRLAVLLHKKGVRKKDFVALLLPRTFFVYVAELAVMKLGAVFVPLLPSYPDERIAFCLQDAACSLVITTKALQEKHSAVLRAGYKLLLQEECSALDCQVIRDEESRSLVTQSSIEPDDLAYCLYTSGTTGKPKGVKISHSNLVNYVHVNPKSPVETAYVAHGKVSLAMAAFSFDVAIEEAYLPLCHGNSVCLATEEEILTPKRLAELICSRGVTALCATPSFLSTLLTLPECQTALRQIECFDIGAESFPPTLLPQLRSLRSDSLIINSYGPTESTVACAGIALEPGDEVTIGRPMANVSFVVADRYGKAVPLGLRGELIICGAGVGRGYQDLPEQTTESFFSYGNLPAYHSGDLAAWTAEGCICLYGRMDKQIKVHGFRIELDEIEKAMLAFAGLREAVVLVQDERLVGYITASHSIDSAELKAALAQKLASYMVPSLIVQLDEMPLTPHGKLDRRALPDLSHMEDALPYTAPTTELEAEMADAFATVLGREKVSIDLDFFEAGGSSLRAMQVLSLLRLPALHTAMLFQYRTVRKIAEAYSSEASSYEKEEQAGLHEELALMPFQTYMLDYQFYTPHSTMLNMTMFLRFGDAIDAERLRLAVNTVLQHHPAFGTIFSYNENIDLVQHYEPIRREVSLEYCSEAELIDIREELIQPFSLLNAPLYRCRLFATEYSSYLFFDVHHTISDGFSIDVFLQNLKKAYFGEPLKRDFYYAYLKRELAKKESAFYEKSKQYFEELYEGKDWVSLPRPDYSSRENTIAIIQADIPIPPALFTKIEQDYGISRNLFFIAVSLLALAKYNGKEAIFMTWTYNYRDSLEKQDMFGQLLQDIPLGIEIERNESIRSFMKRVKRRIDEGVQHACYPYTLIDTNVVEDDKTCFLYQKELKGFEQSEAFSCEDISLPNPFDASENLFNIEVIEAGENLSLDFMYSSTRYAASSIQEFRRIYQKIALRIAQYIEEDREVASFLEEKP